MSDQSARSAIERSQVEMWLNTAETLLLQHVPATHDGRNTWLLNMGVSEEAHRQRVIWNERNHKDEWSQDRLDPKVAVHRERLLSALSQSRPMNTAIAPSCHSCTDPQQCFVNKHCAYAPCENPFPTNKADFAPSSTEEIASEQDAMRFFDRETDEVGWREAIRKLYRIVKAQSAASAIRPKQEPSEDVGGVVNIWDMDYK